MQASERERMNYLYQKNFKLLPPWIQKTISDVDRNDLWENVEIKLNEQGDPICRYKGKEKFFNITSALPKEEASKWCDSINLSGAGAIFMYGTGFGYSLFELFKRKHGHSLVVVFEQNIHLFTAMLYYFDLEPIVNSQKIVFLIGGSDHFAQAFEQLFFSVVFANCTSPAIVFTLSAKRNFKDVYVNIHNYVFSQLGLFVFYIGNDHLDNLIGLNNLLANINEIVLNPFISSLKSKFKDVPVFIIANGPSLDKNINHLDKIKRKGLIIATESAIIPLTKNKIKPDILTIIERTKYTFTYHFEDQNYPEDIALLSLGLVDKNVYPSFKGPKIPIYRKGEAINEWINSFLGDGSALEAGANVSHLAFELAVYLGGNPIVFVGQDYAYGEEGLTHSKDAVYSKEKGKRAREILKSKPIVYVEGNNGTMIPSNQLWTDFRNGLERKIASHKNKTIINATEGGAKIQGAKCEKLSDVIDFHCKEDISNSVNYVINEEKKKIDVYRRLDGLKEFINSVHNYSDYFRRLSKDAVKGRAMCREMVDLSRCENQQNNRETLEKAYQSNILFYNTFIEDSLYRCFCQQLIFVYFYLMNRVGYIDTQDKITEIFQIQHDFFHHLNIVSQSVSVYLEEAIQHLSELLEKQENLLSEGVKQYD